MEKFGEQQWAGAPFGPVNKLIDQNGLEKVIHHLYQDAKIGPTSFLEVYETSLKKTDSGINPYQAINKLRRCYNLCKFFEITWDTEGDIAEAGVFKGSTARLMVELLAASGKDLGDKAMLLFDSYEGLPEGKEEDGVSNKLVHGQGKDEFHQKTTRRFSSTSEEEVQRRLSDISGVETVKGWIPDTFPGYEDRRFSFVHIDVDLYQPTKDCLNFFLPRMNPGGAILCDDYLSLRFVGARKGWDEVCTEKGVQFVTLDNYQSLILC